MNTLTLSHIHLQLPCNGSTNNFRFLLPEAASQILSSQPAPLQTSALYWEQLGNRVLQKAFFNGAQPRHFSLMPYFSGLCTPCDLDLHFACLRIKKKSIDMCYSSCKIIVTTEVMQQRLQAKAASFIQITDPATVLSVFAAYRHPNPSSGQIKIKF